MREHKGVPLTSVVESICGISHSTVGLHCALAPCCATVGAVLPAVGSLVELPSVGHSSAPLSELCGARMPPVRCKVRSLLTC